MPTTFNDLPPEIDIEIGSWVTDWKDFNALRQVNRMFYYHYTTVEYIERRFPLNSEVAIFAGNLGSINTNEDNDYTPYLLKVSGTTTTYSSYREGYPHYPESWRRENWLLCDTLRDRTVLTRLLHLDFDPSLADVDPESLFTKSLQEITYKLLPTETPEEKQIASEFRRDGTIHWEFAHPRIQLFLYSYRMRTKSDGYDPLIHHLAVFLAVWLRGRAQDVLSRTLAPRTDEYSPNNPTNILFEVFMALEKAVQVYNGLCNIRTNWVKDTPRPEYSNYQPLWGLPTDLEDNEEDPEDAELGNGEDEEPDEIVGGQVHVAGGGDGMTGNQGAGAGAQAHFGTPQVQFKECLE